MTYPKRRDHAFRRASAPSVQVAARPSFSIFSAVFKYGALPLTVLSVILALLSYGYVLGLLEPFRVFPEQLQLSAFDYLQRSYRPLLAGFVYSTETGTFSNLIAWTENIWWRLWWVALLLSVFFVALVYFAANDLDLWRPVRVVLRTASQWNRSVRSRLLGFSTPVVMPLAVVTAIAITGLAIWAALTLFISFVAFVPVLGATSGLAAAREGVIQPRKCRAPAISMAVRSPGARCVRITQDGKEVARGRFIEQGPTRVLLYRPSTESVLSVPIERSVIEDVDAD